MSFDKNISKPNKKVIKSSTAKDTQLAKWWNEKKDNIHNSVFGIVNSLNYTQSVRHLNNLKFARLYENLDVTSYAFGFYDAQAVGTGGRLPAWNVVKSCIDTVANKIAKTRPRIDVVTQDGPFKLQDKAKKLTQYLDGLFDLTNAYEISQRVFKDAAKFGTGCGYCYVDEDHNVVFERVLPWEIVVDDGEGLYQEPRQMHRRKLIQRDVLKAQYPKFETEIDGAATVNVNPVSSVVPPDMVLVVESWHLPSGSKSKDGRHAICIENATLFEEDYTKSYFPFVFMRWEERTVGFWGMGLAEELAGSQLYINKMLRFIELCQERMAVPRILVDELTKLSTDLFLNNGIGDIINYTGNAPVPWLPANVVNGEIYAHLENVYKKCYETTGISQLSAMSQKPAGLDSGLALSTYEDIQSERMALTAQRYERFFVDLSKLMIDLSKDVYAEDKGITVKVTGSKFVETIKWKDVDMNDDQYTMRPFPTNLLPSTPAGKLNTIVQLTQAGFIPKEYGLSLLSFPDLDKFVNLQTAALNDTYRLIDQMLEEGVYEPPDPLMNLQLTQTVVHSAYLKAKTQTGIPPENLQLLRKFLKDSQSILDLAQPPAPAMPAPGSAAQANPAAPGLPQANPMPAPVSQLLPTG